MAAVKANAYRHGAVPCARRLEAEGVDWFGVALPEEGVELRSAGITKPILCLGRVLGRARGLMPAGTSDPGCLPARHDRIVRSRGAGSRRRSPSVHLKKVDTGMGRLGVRGDALAEFCEILHRCKNIRLDGLMTHLAAADDPSREDFTRTQLDRFAQAASVFRERGFMPTYLHGANSAAAFAFPESRGNMVRPGATLYGFVRDVLPPNIPAPPLRPVMSVRSRIMLLKQVDKAPRSWVTTAPSKPRA